MAVHKDNTGTETSVFTVMVDKPGTQLLTPASAQLDQFGMDMPVSTLAVVEEFSMPPTDNVSVQLVTGTALYVLSAQIPKSGHHQD